MILDDIVKQREKLRKGVVPYLDHHGAGHNSYGGFLLDDGELVVNGTGVCHGWMQIGSMAPRKITGRMKFVLSSVMKSWGTRPQTLAHTDWLINRSPWASIFVDKNAESVLELGHVLDVTQPANLIGSGVIASRFFTESYVADARKRIRGYLEFLNLGCSENEALLFSQLYSFSDSSYPVNYSRFSSGHAVFYSNGVGAKYYKNFLTNNPTLLTESFNELGGYRTGTLNAVWGSNGSDSFSVKVQALRPIKAQKKKDLNIFRKVNRDAWTYDNAADLKSVTNQLKELIYA